MKGKYKVPVIFSVSIWLVALLIVTMILAGCQDFPREIELNTRHPLGEIIELEGPSSLEDCERFQDWVQEHKDDFWFKEFKDDTRLHVGLFVQEFYYARDLRDDVLYRDIDQDGAVRIGVKSQDVIEEFEELGIPITFEIIDLEGVRHLEEAAGEIDEKPYVMGAFYSYSKGRITVELDKPDWDRYEDIYQEYPDYPLLFWLSDPQPE
jgi:hypothetical protein